MRALLAPDCRGGRSAQGCARCDSRRPRSRSAAGIARVSHRLSRMSIDVAETAIVYPGTVLGEGCRILDYAVVGDQACVRERCDVGDDVVIGRGTLVENDTTIGRLTKVQADAYITAHSTLEDNVFIAPRVITSNDNFMGRTEKRHALRKGPTIRRGARVGAGAVICPAVEIGVEAFVGAGAVVVKDVPPKAVVVGNPARVLRDVPSEELL